MRLSFSLVWILLIASWTACTSPEGGDDDSSDDDSSPSGDALPMEFPQGFVWGSASAGYQVEGNYLPSGETVQSNWSEWEELGNIQGKATNDVGTGFYTRYDEDFALAEADGHTAYRMGIEWARIEPQPGVWDEEAMAHYGEQVDAARARGLTPWLTLHHWVVPRWVSSQEAGRDMLSEEAPSEFVSEFEEFVRHITPEMAASVDHYVILNEPFSVIALGYLQGLFPPGDILDLEAAKAVAANYLFAHARACAALRELDTVDADGDGVAVSCGLAQAANVFYPLDEANPVDVSGAERINYIYTDLMMVALTGGLLDVDLDGLADNKGTEPPEGFYPELAGTLDWIGINYYGPGRVQGIEGLEIGGIPLLDVAAYDDFLPHNEMGREISAPAFRETLELYAVYGLPMFITENGCGDSDDSQRPFYLLEHLRTLGQAIGEGLPVRGYFHWSLTDNFEWAYGFEERFGLYRVDFEDPELPRIRNDSAELYSTIIEDNGIVQETWDAFALEKYPSDGR